MTLQPFSDSHLMTINAIKGLGPALGDYIYNLHHPHKVHNSLHFTRDLNGAMSDAVTLLIR
ncbi:hypothetical protein L195_g026541 [Trifolium pratense]|uniref:Uncharacterized protein n=1 Tax=Trifolium pratense TaxID=57577 RepID=A0A2K3NJJ0_TRIPR|nr:hypothetical protein L195_g026541 [Trifolium pratense]